MLKKLFTHTAIYGIAPHVPKIAGIFALPIITPYLTELDYGVFGLILAVAGGLGVFSHLGMTIILSNSFYRSPMQYKWAWRQIYGFLYLWNIPYTFILAGALYFITPAEAMINIKWIILLNTLPGLIFGPAGMIGTFYYQLKQKPIQVGVRSAIIGFLGVGLNILFIYHYKMGYMGWFLTSFITGIFMYISYFIPVNFIYKLTPIFNFKRKYIRQRLNISLPMVPHYYSGYLLDSSDKLVMKFMDVTIGNLGLYNVAANIGNLGSMIGVASGQAVGPMLLESYKNKNDKQARQIVFSLQITFLLGSFIACLWMKEIFQFLVRNASLQKVYPLAIIIAMGYNYRPMYFGAVNVLFYHEKTKILPRITFVAGISNVILNLLLIPFFGYQAAAYTTFATLMYMGYIGYYLKEYKEHSTVKFYPMYWLTMTIVFTFLAYFLVDWSEYIKIMISLFMMFLLGISLYIINKI